MTAQVEIELSWMRDADVDCCACWNISRLAALFLLVSAEQARVMTLLNDDEGDTGTVVSFKFDTSLADRGQLVLQDVWELAFGDTVAVQNNSVWLVAAGGLVEHHQEFTYHAA